MARQLENPFYYLDNFESVLNWVEQRYADILHSHELDFVRQYQLVPKASRALLARMVMRKGVLFRQSRLSYSEIGCADQALAPLVQAGWVDLTPQLQLSQLFQVFTKSELLCAFRSHGLSAAMSKAQLQAQLAAMPQYAHEPIAALSDWWNDASDAVVELLIMPLCERFRLMFFGNLRQDWSEFVLTDLGLLRYETVSFGDSCRAMSRRQDIDDYLHVHSCVQRLQEGQAAEEVMACVPAQPYENPWMERRRAKLLFRIGQACERSQAWESALQAYKASSHAQARLRSLRVLERSMRYEPALQGVEAALSEPINDAEAQQLVRMRPRLRRKLGMPVPALPRVKPPASFTLQAEPDNAAQSVEELARRHLHGADTPAYYVENTLVNALFALLCWEALFQPLPGAFFHPFQRGPADLHEPDFVLRRQRLFDACLMQLDSGQYRDTIQSNFLAKNGCQCSFMHWPALSAELLEHALHCIPAQHLKKWFLRMLDDIPGNRSGFPDLIQFRPADQSYRMVEVKGPGDRLQDNQSRWLDFFAGHDMPVEVCLVRWIHSS